MPPVVPTLALAGLRAQVESGLIHQAERQTVIRTRLASGEYVETVAWAEPVDALLTPASAEALELAAAKGIAAQWDVKFRLAEPVRTDEVWRITGDTDGVEWTRVVKITGDLGLTNKVARRVLAVDTELNVQGATERTT